MRQLLLALLLTISVPAWAARGFPIDMQIAEFKSSDGKQIVLSKDGITWVEVITLGLMSDSQENETYAGVKVRDEKGRSLPPSKWSTLKGKKVGIRFAGDKLSEVWALSDKDAKKLRKKIKERKERKKRRERESRFTY